MRIGSRPALCAAVALVALIGGASPALAASPWWHLTSRVLPSRVQPGSATNELQEITASPEDSPFFGKGAAFTVSVNKAAVGTFATEEVAKIGFPEPTAENIEKALEGEQFYGPGGVSVTGGPVGVTTGAMPLVVTVRDRAVQPLEVTALVGSANAQILSVGRPDGEILVTAANVGDADANGETESASIADQLPAGLTAVAIEAAGAQCSLASLTCTFSRTLLPYEPVVVRIPVIVTGGVSGKNAASVSGGGAPALTVRHTVPSGSEPVPFGIEDFTLVPEEEGGEVDTHSGSHPYQLTSTLSFNSSSLETLKPPALPRDLHFKLPAGQIGSATALAQCNDADFAHRLHGGEANRCQDDTAIGVVTVTFSLFPREEVTKTVPLFNLVPAYGEPARFGFEVLGNPVILDTAVRSGPGEDYGVTVNVSNVTQLINFMSATTTFWGAPADPSHNNSRGWGCLLGERYAAEAGLVCIPSVDSHPAAFLTLPTNCTAPFNPILEGVSWPTNAAPGGFTFPPLEYRLQDAAGSPLSLTGCNQLAFSPIFSAAPTTDSASSPSGLNVNLDFDDEGLTNGSGSAQSQLNKSIVTLPEGLTVNPSSGVGLAGCTRADYAAETVESASGTGCPNNAKLGTVEIETPLLTQKIYGSLFIAQPYENPFNSLLALYIVAKNPETGVLVKLAGKVTPNPITGQLTTVFENNPQLPFSHFNFHFHEGQQAPLITPPTCGTYNTEAGLFPWSSPTSMFTATSSFQITHGVGGGPCPSGTMAPFGPQIEAGTLTNSAGSFSPLYLRLTRNDGDQEIAGFSTDLPAGLTGDLSGIPFCPEADITLARSKTGAQEEAEPSCPPASQVGRTLVGTGVGSVLSYVPGKIYLAGPYNGDPFSLVAVTSAVVGPFDLGTVVLRFALRIDPYTAKISVDPTISEPIPTIIQGIVTHVRDIRVYIDRSNFTLNPTSCNPLEISSTLTSDLGQSTTISSPFQATNCANLAFAPKVAVSTSGKTSKANGASLSFKLTYPKAPQGDQANIASVKVDLPRQLPSRLTTLQKACTAKQFDNNPAGCPTASIIGHVKAITPLIPLPLEGPAIFVSHGGEAFPSLTFVLQGYGITIDLVGDTFISKAGVTSTTLKAVPDQPVGSFELTLPQGRYSALAANGNLCKSKLLMPAKFVAQNGDELRESIRIAVTGCAKRLTRAQKLAKAMKACREEKNRTKRIACARQAHARYRATRAATK